MSTFLPLVYPVVLVSVAM